MREIIVTAFISLDGVVEAPGGEEGFKHTGWTFDIETDPTMYDYKFEETREAGAQLLGRRTYEGFAAAWPGREGDFADLFNSMPKYVVSSKLENPEWTNSRVLKGDLVKEVSKLRDEQEGEILVHGSAQLVQALLEHGLVDELRLMVFPVTIGAGLRVFPDTVRRTPWRRVDSLQFPPGPRVDVYRRA